MTIFGDNNASQPSAMSNCNFELHTGTEFDSVMNTVLACVLVVAALVSVLGNFSVFVYYSKSQSAPFSEFLARQYITVIRAIADLLYNARSIYIAVVLLKDEQEELCSCSCSKHERILDIFNIIMFGLFMVSLILTFVISVLNYANVLGYTINRMIYGPNLRYRARVAFFVITIVLFIMVFALEMISTTGIDFNKNDYYWFSPIQLDVYRAKNSSMNFQAQKWILFGSKSLLLFFHIFFAVVGWVNLVKMDILRSYNLKRLCFSMCLLILGNCLCLILSLVKDLVTDFIDFATNFQDHGNPGLPYIMTYLLFGADVLMQSLLAAYNPVIFVVNSKSVQRTVLQTLTETVVFTNKVSVSRNHTIQQADDVEQATSKPVHRSPQPRRLQVGPTRPTSVTFNRTISITVYTSVDVAEPVTGEAIRLPLNHIPSIPTISIPVTQLLNPMRMPFIGGGYYGKVYKYTDELIGCSVALKHIQLVAHGRVRSTIEDVKKEININSQLTSHNNIVQYVGCVGLEQSNWYIIQEYMLLGSLKSKLEIQARQLTVTDQQTQPVLPEGLILKFTMEMACGLEYLHQQKIVHRDLRSPNVLISSTETAKLADFGLSKKLEAVVRTAGDYTPDVGNAYWRAPEVMNTEECGFPVDVWSLGITILEMIYNEPPFMNDEPFKYMWKLARSKKIPEIPQFVGADLQEVLKICLMYDPAERPLASELLKRILEIRK